MKPTRTRSAERKRVWVRIPTSNNRETFSPVFLVPTRGELVLAAVRRKRTDLAGEVMVHSQAQRLLLQSNKGCGALLTAPNFPVGPPRARTDRHAAPACGGHGAPDALPQTSRQGLV